MPHCKVIQKKQRPGPLHRNIVDTMVYKVFPDRVVPPRREGNLQLGSDAVDGTDQNRLLHLRHREASAEGSDIRQNTFREG